MQLPYFRNNNVRSILRCMCSFYPESFQVCNNTTYAFVLELLLSCDAGWELFLWGDSCCTVIEYELRAWDCAWALWLKIMCSCQCTWLWMLSAYKKTVSFEAKTVCAWKITYYLPGAKIGFCCFDVLSFKC